MDIFISSSALLAVIVSLINNIIQNRRLRNSEAKTGKAHSELESRVSTSEFNITKLGSAHEESANKSSATEQRIFRLEDFQSAQLSINATIKEQMSAQEEKIKDISEINKELLRVCLSNQEEIKALRRDFEGMREDIKALGKK